MHLIFSMSQGNIARLKVAQKKPGPFTVSGHVSAYAYDRTAKVWFQQFDCAISGTATGVDVSGSAVWLDAPGSGSCTVMLSPGETVEKRGSVPSIP